MSLIKTRTPQNLLSCLVMLLGRRDFLIALDLQLGTTVSANTFLIVHLARRLLARTQGGARPASLLRVPPSATATCHEVPALVHFLATRKKLRMFPARRVDERWGATRPLHGHQKLRLQEQLPHVGHCVPILEFPEE